MGRTLTESSFFSGFMLISRRREVGNVLLGSLRERKQRKAGEGDAQAGPSASAAKPARPARREGGTSGQRQSTVHSGRAEARVARLKRCLRSPRRSSPGGRAARTFAELFERKRLDPAHRRRSGTGLAAAISRSMFAPLHADETEEPPIASIVLVFSFFCSGASLRKGCARRWRG